MLDLDPEVLFPAGHQIHAVEFGSPWYLATSQSEQTDIPDHRAYVPGRHARHDVAFEGETLPGVQATQPDIPDPLANVPPRQKKHWDALFADVYWPELQLKHVEDAIAAEYLPGTQALQ